MKKGIAMKPTFVCYPRCSTCKKAQKWLEEHGIDFEIRHIAEDNPSKKEIKAWSKDSGLPLKRFFNTSGQLYRSLELKDRLGGMSDDEQYDLLASDGMLVKRPILVGPNYVLVGFREEEWAETLL